MAKRWTVSKAYKAALAKATLNSRNVSEVEKKKVEADWTDINRRYPNVATEFYTWAQQPESHLLLHFADYVTLRKIENAFRDKVDYSLVPDKHDSDVETLDVSENGSVEHKKNRGRKHQEFNQESLPDVDDLLTDERIEI